MSAMGSSSDANSFECTFPYGVFINELIDQDEAHKDGDFWSSRCRECRKYYTIPYLIGTDKALEKFKGKRYCEMKEQGTF